MPRKLLIRTDTLPYHVTARANNKEPFPIEQDRMWKILGSECLTLSFIYDVEFHAVVMMPNHIHMLMTTPTHDLGKVMNILMSNVTRRCNRASGRSGHVFGGPYHWTLIGSSRYFGHALKYVYRNPVRALIAGSVETYPYSSLHGLLGRSHLPFPIHFTRANLELNLPDLEGPQLIPWLNTPFPKEAEELIRKNLRKRTFDTILNRNNRRPNEILQMAL
jgi:putative transposase